MRGCFDIQDKKLPNPKGKYYQRYGNKPFTPYKKKGRRKRKERNW